MQFITNQLSSGNGEAALPVVPAPAQPDAAGSNSSGSEPVRILVYGSEQAVRHTIHQLHVLRFAEQFRWNPIAAIPPGGLYVGPEVAAAYSFLLRELRL